MLRVESASERFGRSPLGTNQNIVIGLVPVVVAKLQRLPLPVTLHNEGLSVQQHETTFKTNGYIASSGELHTTYMYYMGTDYACNNTRCVQGNVQKSINLLLIHAVASTIHTYVSYQYTCGIVTISSCRTEVLGKHWGLLYPAMVCSHKVPFLKI